MNPAVKAAIEEAIRAVVKARAEAWQASDAANEALTWADRAKTQAGSAAKAADEAASALSRILDAVKLTAGPGRDRSKS